ncbi:MAG: hypothetical protein AAB702_01840 [Patescibacteria group bacterium]
MANKEIGNFINRKTAALALVGTMAIAGCGGDAKASIAPSQTPSTSPSGEVAPIDYDKLAEAVVKAIGETNAANETAGQSAAPITGSTETAKSAELPTWPKTAKEAGMLFGTDVESKKASRWEPSADGGWHFREEAFVSAVNPQGYVLDGYFDTKPGKNPDCFVSNGVAVGVQGATIWPVSGEQEATILLDKMALPKWDDGKVHPCRAVGFTPTK